MISYTDFVTISLAIMGDDGVAEDRDAALALYENMDSPHISLEALGEAANGLLPRGVRHFSPEELEKMAEEVEFEIHDDVDPDRVLSMVGDLRKAKELARKAAQHAKKT
jgi:hypothetical protein